MFGFKYSKSEKIKDKSHKTKSKKQVGCGL